MVVTLYFKAVLQILCPCSQTHLLLILRLQLFNLVLLVPSLQPVLAEIVHRLLVEQFKCNWITARIDLLVSQTLHGAPKKVLVTKSNLH